MNVKNLLRGVLTTALRVLDSDGDGKVEIADLPGAIAKIASMEAQGRALIAAAGAAIGAFTSMAGAGQLTTGGVPATPAEVEAMYAKSKDNFFDASDISRQAMAETPKRD